MVKAGKKFRRAMESSRLSAFFRPDGLDECLRCWVTWMRNHDGTRKLGIKTQRGLMGDGDGYGTDLDGDQMRRDMEIAAATQAMIDSLSNAHQWSIYTAYNMGNGWQQWRFNSLDPLETLTEAKLSLSDKLRRNSCTSSLF